MRAAVVRRYGGPEVVDVVERDTPRPSSGELLVRVHAAAVTIADARIRGSRFPPGMTSFARIAFGVLRPRRKILGSAFSGVVEACGPTVSAFAVGDEVCGMTGIRFGAHAEYLTVPAKRVVTKPAAVSHDQAAGVLFGGTAALHFVRSAKIRAGETVLINGAAGAVGANAVQLAATQGATVTAVTSTSNISLVRSIGADEVIDYTAKDVFSKDVFGNDVSSNDVRGSVARFDVVIDTVGNISVAAGKRLLAPGGRLMLVAAGLADMLRARGNVTAGTAPERAADFSHLLDLVAAGDLRVLNEHVYELDDIADAHRLIDTGHKVGDIIVHP